MRPRPNRDDACAAAHALSLIGERWALLVARQLLLGPKRFSDLRAGLSGISPNVLTQRLEDLEAAGVLRRRKLEPPAAAWVYELTEWGMDLEPVILALGRWGVRSPFRAQGSINADSLMLSFRAMFDPAEAEGFSATLELRIGEERFRAAVVDGVLTVERGAAENADATLEAGPNEIAAVVYGGRRLTDAIAAGEVKIAGSRSVAKKFLSLFPLPQPVSAPAR